MNKEIKKCKVYATVNNSEYVMGYVSYTDKSERFELFLDESQAVIFKNKHDANHAISEHKRTRQDQKVNKYKIITVF